jgi:hypothetical protein
MEIFDDELRAKEKTLNKLRVKLQRFRIALYILVIPIACLALYMSISEGANWDDYTSSIFLFLFVAAIVISHRYPLPIFAGIAMLTAVATLFSLRYMFNNTSSDDFTRTDVSGSLFSYAVLNFSFMWATITARKMEKISETLNNARQ